MTLLRVAGAVAAGVLAFGCSQARAERHSFNRVEVAFVLDSTGSMGDLIDGAKRKIWSIANSIVDANPDAQIAMSIVTYRDKGDEYVVKSTPLSEDVQGLYGKLMRIEAGGGGDTPESVNEALDKTISGLQWTSSGDTRRIVFLVGDAPPHMNYNERRYPEILKSANERKIIVNAVQAGDDMETTHVWKEIAQAGGGRFMSIPQDGGHIVVIETPFDGEILSLQRELDSSIVPYGSADKKAEVASKVREKAAAPASVSLDSSTFYSKRKVAKEVVTGGGDLVSEVASGKVSNDLGDIAEKDMPEELKGKDADARKAWIKRKVETRSKLEAAMASLVAKRDAYVKAEREKAPAKDKDSFNAAVEDALKSELN